MAFVTSLKHFAKCRTGKKFLRKKYQNLIPAKYKATFFYMWMDRNRQTIILAYTFTYELYELIATIPSMILLNVICQQESFCVTPMASQKQTVVKLLTYTVIPELKLKT